MTLKVSVLLKIGLDQTWFLHRSQLDPMRRELHTLDAKLEFVLGDEGFTPRN